MVMPIMNFPVLNPVGTGIRTGLDVSRGIQDLLSSQQERKFSQQMHPYKLSQQEYITELARLNKEKELANQPYYQDIARAMQQEKMAKGSMSQSQADLSSIAAQLAREGLPSKRKELEQQLIQKEMEIEKQKLFQKMGWYTPEQQEMGSMILMMSQGYPGMTTSAPEDMGQIVEPSISEGIQEPYQYGPGFVGPEAYQEKTPDQIEEYYISSYLPKRLTPQEQMDQKIRDLFEYRTSTKAQQIGLEERAKKEETFRANTMESLAESADSANEIQMNLDLALDNFKKLGFGEKGWVLGTGPATSTRAQLVDKAVERLLQDAQKEWKGTVPLEQIKGIKKQFTNRAMTDEAFMELYNIMSEANRRALLKHKFYSSGFDSNMKKDKVDESWNKLMRENPIYISTEDALKRVAELERKAAQ